MDRFEVMLNPRFYYRYLSTKIPSLPTNLAIRGETDRPKTEPPISMPVLVSHSTRKTAETPLKGHSRRDCVITIIEWQLHKILVWHLEQVMFSV